MQLAAGAARRDPGPAAQQGLALGAAGEGHDDPLAGRPRSSRCRGRPGSARGPRRRGRPARAGRARAAPTGCRPGSSSRARRRPSRPCRCCRGPSGGAAPPGDMSTSSIWSARRTTSSGTVSRWTMPVIDSTTSLSDSRCWMLTVEMTSMPASSSSSMSCQRFSWRDAGLALVCASSSTSADRGAAREDGVEVHLLELGAAVGHAAPGDAPRDRRSSPRCARGRGSRRDRRRRRCRGSSRRWPSSSMATVLPTPGAAPR